MTTTVSAKIPDDLKEAVDQADINVSSIIRDALETEIAERRREQLQQDATELSDAVDDAVTTDEIVSAVRETRQEH
jgi:post-segregation antitoxin (ccd killing protein)